MNAKPKYPAVPLTQEEQKTETRRLARFLKGKTVKKVWRHRPKEVAIVFSDGTTLYVDHCAKGLETSVTG
jgi:hypothetical protein